MYSEDEDELSNNNRCFKIRKIGDTAEIVYTYDDNP